VSTITEVVCGDLHVPYHDPVAIGCMLGYMKDNPPDGFTVAGDFADFYQISRFDKEPRRELEFQADIDACNAILDAIDAVLPEGCKKRFLIGNHEDRLQKFLKTPQARAISSLRCLTVESLLRLEERGYQVVPMVGRDSSVKVGLIEVGHFNKVNQHSAYTERALVDERGCSIMQLHTHRRGAFYKRLRGTGEEIGGWGPGCLCDLNPEYVTSPNWMSGFASITKCADSDRYHVNLHEIIGGELLVGNTRYTA
jgi:hypothetical protein